MTENDLLPQIVEGMHMNARHAVEADVPHGPFVDPGWDTMSDSDDGGTSDAGSTDGTESDYIGRMAYVHDYLLMRDRNLDQYSRGNVNRATSSIAHTPMEPPFQRYLDDSAEFCGHDAPIWLETEYNHHVLSEPTTKQPARLALEMKIKTHNFHLLNGDYAPDDIRSAGKIFCVGTPVGFPGSDRSWRKSMKRLYDLREAFAEAFPKAAAADEEKSSFMQRSVDGIKMQQPLMETERCMYGLGASLPYAHFLRDCPDEYKHIYPRASPIVPSSSVSQININPWPIYDTDGSLMPPKDYGEKIDDSEAIVEVEFTLHHFVLARGRPRCFIAVPNHVSLVHPDDLEFIKRTEREDEGVLGTTNHDQEVKGSDEPDDQQEKSEDVHEGGLKRKRDDDADEDVEIRGNVGVVEGDKDDGIRVKGKGKEYESDVKIEGGSDQLEVSEKKRRLD